VVVPPVTTQVRPRLGITKTGPPRARGLQRITYTIRVRNTGGRRPQRGAHRPPAARPHLHQDQLRSTFRSGIVTVKLGTLRPRQVPHRPHHRAGARQHQRPASQHGAGPRHPGAARLGTRRHDVPAAGAPGRTGGDRLTDHHT